MKKIILLFMTGFLMAQSLPAEAAGSGQEAGSDHSIRRGEQRQTLDPAGFADPIVRNAYQIARDIPWVLDSIYCYCKCEESPVFRHASLLSCYVDNHAAV